jgi:hypothetical protein
MADSKYTFPLQMLVFSTDYGTMNWTCYMCLVTMNVSVSLTLPQSGRNEH